MTVEVGIWRVGEKKPEKVQFSRLQSEEKLEDMLFEDLAILDPSLLLIGRQVPTDFGKFIDLLALDADGKVVVIELKRDCTPREVVAQVLDYGSWVHTLETENIAAIFSAFNKKYHPQKTELSLDQAFCEKFNVSQLPEELNDGHELYVVASELDASTERIVNYLADVYGVGINVAFFRFFKDGNHEYLSRAWMIDPSEAEAKSVEKRGSEPWNGESYVSFGEDKIRHWEDARKYGFICAGGGAWFSRTLEKLEPGDRIWVNVPGQGYVGVGRVKQKPVALSQFTLPDETGKETPAVKILPYAVREGNHVEDEEHYVLVDWIKTVPLKEAIKEKGFFGNQNSAAKPVTPKWNHTIERLKQRFNIKD